MIARKVAIITGSGRGMGAAIARKLANDGYNKTLKNDSNFLAGLNVHKGQVTYKAVADAFGHAYFDAKELLN